MKLSLDNFIPVF